MFRVRQHKSRQRGRLRQGGVILIETLVGISVISTTVLASLMALSTASIASQQVADETQAAVAVVSQIELIRTLPYVTTGNSYTSITPPSGYTISNTTTAYPGGDSNIQNVTVTVQMGAKVVQEKTIVKINR